MIATENKNLIITYAITLGVAAFLTVVIVNFNNWFFPNEEFKLSDYTPTSRGMISQRELRFGVLSDQKFTGLEPILNPDQLVEAIPPKTEPGAVTGTLKPATRPPVELRHNNPFLPF
jgi:hypothetical protein